MEEIDLKEFFSYYLSKILIVVLAVFLTILVGNLYANFIRTPLYQSNTTVILVNKNTQTENSAITQSDIQLNQNLVPTYSSIIKSKKVVKQVLKDEFLDYSVDQLTNMISVSNVPNTQIINITVTSPDAAEAADIANAIVPIFSEEVAQTYEMDNIRVIDKAEEAEAPYNVNFLKDNVIYMLIGVVLGSVIVFLIFYFDTTIKSVDVIEEKFGLTVLGVVPTVGRK